MNLKHNPLSGVAACMLLALAAGCGKTEPPNAEAGTNAPGALATAATQVKAVATKVGKEAALEYDSLKPQVERILDQAKGLVAEQKYSEALGSLKQLGELKLTPEHQKIVDDLKARIQKFTSNETVSNALNAAGNLLK